MAAATLVVAATLMVTATLMVAAATLTVAATLVAAARPWCRFYIPGQTVAVVWVASRSVWCGGDLAISVASQSVANPTIRVSGHRDAKQTLADLIGECVQSRLHP